MFFENLIPCIPIYNLLLNYNQVKELLFLTSSLYQNTATLKQQFTEKVQTHAYNATGSHLHLTHLTEKL